MRRISSSLVIVCLFLIQSLFCFFVSSEEDWSSLFNGRDLSQWVVKCKPADQEKQFWTVTDGVIQADSLGRKGHDYVWLMTRSEYQDFTLALKFRAFRNSPGNSGVQIRSRYDETEGWLNGPQIDIHPKAPWRCGMIWDETRGVQRWIFPNLPKGQWVNESMSVPKRIFHYADDDPSWNQLIITVDGLTVTAALNGVLITTFQGEGILNDQHHQKRNVGESGHIALQIHKGDQLKIQFKDIIVKERPR